MKAGTCPECMLGRRVVRRSPAHLAAAMEEVHQNIPSTVRRAKHFGPGGREAMLRAVAYSKARKRR